MGSTHASLFLFYNVHALIHYILLAHADDSLTLDSLLIQIRSQVTPKWYRFGLAVGIAEEILNKYSNCPPEECIIEMLDYWLRNSYIKPTWKDVAEALKKIELQQLAESILTVYRTGGCVYTKVHLYNYNNQYIIFIQESCP